MSKMKIYLFHSNVSNLFMINRRLIKKKKKFCCFFFVEREMRRKKIETPP